MGELRTLQIEPGVIGDDSASAAEGYYRDASRVRFRRGLPEVIGGWQKRFPDQLNGKCRCGLFWTDKSQRLNEAYGTHTKLYVRRGGTLYDLTPSGLTAGQENGGEASGGYGLGLYGTGPYGGATSGSDLIRTWDFDQWGENLLALVRGGKLYRWQNNTGTLPTAISGAPTVADGMFKTAEGFICLLATQEQITGDYDPLLARWHDKEDVTTWTATASNAAGAKRCTIGSKNVAGRALQKRNVIWTDAGLCELLYTADQNVYETFPIAEGCGLIGKKAHEELDGVAYWLTRGGVYRWAGGVPERVPCPLEDYLLQNIATGQEDKILVRRNTQKNELWIVFPHKDDGLENSRYVAWQIGTPVWSKGILDRTESIDDGAQTVPIMIGADGYVYEHETGKTANGAAMNAFIEIANIDLIDGDEILRIDAILPDWKEIVGSVNVEITTGYTPNSSGYLWPSMTLNSATTRKACQAQGRWARLKLSTIGAPSWFRMGAPRLELGGTGQRL